MPKHKRFQRWQAYRHDARTNMYGTEPRVDVETVQLLGVWHYPTGPIFCRCLYTRMPFECFRYGEVIGSRRLPDAEQNPSAGHEDTMHFPKCHLLVRKELEALLTQDDVE